MADALQHGAPIPAGYSVVNVDFQKYSADFCTLRMEKVAPDGAEPTPLHPVEPAAPTLPFESLPLDTAA